VLASCSAPPSNSQPNGHEDSQDRQTDRQDSGYRRRTLLCSVPLSSPRRPSYMYRRQATCRALFVRLFRSSLSLPFCCFVHSFTRFHPIFCAGLLTAATATAAAVTAAGWWRRRQQKQQQQSGSCCWFAATATATAAVGRRYLLTSLAGCFIVRSVLAMIFITCSALAEPQWKCQCVCFVPAAVTVCESLCVCLCVCVCLSVYVCMRVLRWHCHTNCNKWSQRKGNLERATECLS